MHRCIRDNLEQVLESQPPDIPANEYDAHLQECAECRAEVARLREQAGILREELRGPAGLEPHPGFYARVMERIEAEGAASIWNMFVESAFGRRIAVASLAMALLLGICLVTAERMTDEPLTPAVASIGGHWDAADDQSVLPRSLASAGDPDAVLVNLVTYPEQ